MSATATINATSVVVPADTIDQDTALSAFLRFLQSRGEHGSDTAKLVCANGDAVDVPPQIFNLLGQVAGILAQGDGVAINAVSKELSTTEAAGLLGMSRPTLIRLLETDQIPSHRVGTHRRIRLPELLQFRRQRLHQQRKAYEDLMRECDALGIDE
jgi:excisionase family DNA binding protein